MQRRFIALSFSSAKRIASRKLEINVDVGSRYQESHQRWEKQDGQIFSSSNDCGAGKNVIAISTEVYREIFCFLFALTLMFHATAVTMVREKNMS